MQIANKTLVRAIVASLLVSTAATVVAAGPVPAKPKASTPRFSVEDLGAVQQVAGDINPGLNSKGSTVTYQLMYTQTFAPVLHSKGKLIPLSLPKGYLNGFGYSLNDRNVAVGWVNTTQNPVDSISTTHACQFSEKGPVDLGTLGGRDSQAYAINNGGLIAGKSQLANREVRGFLYAHGKMTGLPPLTGGSSSIGFGINDAGVVTGGSEFKSPDVVYPLVHAVLWTNGKPKDLGALAPNKTSTGYAVNNHNDVVGVAENATGQTVFLYTQGRMLDLDIDGRGFAINDNRQVVGTREGPERGHDIGFLWDNGTKYDLANCIVSDTKWGIEAGYHINNAGQIACYGRFQNMVHALLLTPIKSSK